LISADGKRRTILRAGQYKSLSTDRVILVPGPKNEVACVRRIYEMAFLLDGAIQILAELFYLCEPRPWVNECNRLISTVRPKISQDIILLNTDQRRHWPRLIGGRFSAAVGVVLTGYVAALTLRAAFWQSPHHFHWLLPVDTFLSARATLAGNLVFYGCLVWLCIAFPRVVEALETCWPFTSDWLAPRYPADAGNMA